MYNLAEDITTKMEPTYNLADSASAAANVRRDLNSDLTQKINSLPIIGDLIGVSPFCVSRVSQSRLLNDN